MRDSVGMTLLDQGKDPATFTTADFDEAVGRLQKGVDKNQIRRFTGNDYTSDLDKGDLAACLAWAGDIIQLQAGNPDIKYAIPAPGYITSSDNLLVPAKARHKANAEKLIDFYYEPPIAAQLAAYISYVCPVEGVKDELAKIDPALADNPLIVPDKAMAAKAHAFRSSPARKRRRTRRSSPSSSAPDARLAASPPERGADRRRTPAAARPGGSAEPSTPCPTQPRDHP